MYIIGSVFKFSRSPFVNGHEPKLLFIILLAVMFRFISNISTRTVCRSIMFIDKMFNSCGLLKPKLMQYWFIT